MKLNNNLIFLHIPKNGGTTFNTILDKNYPSNGIFNIHPIGNGILNDQEFINLPNSERENIHLLKGHMNFGFHNHLIGESDYITFLRRPEERIISYYYFVLNLPNHPLHKSVKNQKMSLADFAVKINQTDVNNAQIRLISGVNDKEEIMLEKALDNIEKHFSFIGLVERFDQSLILFKKKHGLKTPYYRSLNTTSKRIGFTELDKETSDIILELNNGDNLLYKTIEKQFNQELKKVKMLKTELFKLEMLNRLFQLYSDNISNNIRLKIKNTLLHSN